MTGNDLFAIVLAAGLGERFGGTKQLACYDGMPLVARAVRTAEAVCGRRVVLVTGREHRRVAAAAAPVMGYFTVNDRYAEGMSTSIRAGTECVRHVAGAVLVMLADQPLVTIEHLAVLAATWRARPDAIVASRYAGTAGPPVIFPRAFFGELEALHGDRGAWPVIAANEGRVLHVEFDRGAMDVDRPEDLTRR